MLRPCWLCYHAAASSESHKNAFMATKTTGKRDKVVIGWSEHVDFPEWHISDLHAKIDTGARTSALHVENLQILGHGYVKFDVILSRKYRHRRVHVRERVTKWAKVRSSTGHYTMRCFVKTTIRLGYIEKEIELSLISRERMQFRMLIGREALQKDFLVDVSKRRVLSDGRKRKKKAAKTKAKAKKGRKEKAK